MIGQHNIIVLDKLSINKNKDVLINLLTANYTINYPDIKNYNFETQALKDIKTMISYSDDETTILLGALTGEKLSGFLWAHEREVFGEIRMHLKHIVVNTKTREKGWGSLLLQNLHEISQKKDIYKIELLTTINNKIATDFYKKKGYEFKRVLLEKELTRTLPNK